ncbi:2,3-epoxybenzoyl-CoA dihydrolase [Paraliomyxa miuraensis]|uniref:2,3-epoxybenzoyl-CoA dihydrolase n=1 Tax=Paraliomyxa miuraensis TaxID=376150 RepID=UPI002258DFFD|nr:2,3-epoxybenzoyl-CoA dihydrolase [Paraliomyxa miuraensis]MCX4240890.1 2,3-epoxybenzoyl-CoA dihydrolase [Paraliomyxa miuraensis]
MQQPAASSPAPVDFEVEPEHYRHWSVAYDGAIARVTMAVDPEGGLREGYELKLNSYDLGVDIELADIVRRMRFEHPEVRVVVLRSGIDRVFCAGANINMLGQSTHAWKVNFCKFTNETRCELEEATGASQQAYVAACNGTTAGGGYELALACEEIYLQDDGNSAVSLPEVPLLGVLPGTGGLTRLVDKRKVRRDRADVFSTTAEGIRGKKAKQWRLVDDVFPRSKFDEKVAVRATALVQRYSKDLPAGERKGVELTALAPEVEGNDRRYRHVALEVDQTARTASLTITGPTADDVAILRRGGEAAQQAGAELWALRAYRELDDALLHLRVNNPTVGLVLVRAKGDAQTVLDHDAALVAARDHWFVREVLLHMGRVLRRMDNTSRSFFALGDRGTAFAGNLLELALAADRFYLLDDSSAPVHVGLGELNEGALPMAHGLTRLQTRLYGEQDTLDGLVGNRALLEPSAADDAGLVTVLLDDIDWDDDVRIAIEERVSLSPDALTGMEQNLRFAGPETPESKIYARLSAWQNWIFIRPNATGPEGALTLYGRPERPSFDWQRV